MLRGQDRVLSAPVFELEAAWLLPAIGEHDALGGVKVASA